MNCLGGVLRLAAIGLVGLVQAKFKGMWEESSLTSVVQPKFRGK